MGLFVVLVLRAGSDGVMFITDAPELEIPEMSLLTIFHLGIARMVFLCSQ